MCERAALQSHVFPEMKRWCGMRGIEFYDVDMRLGMEKREPPIGVCLDELDRASIVLGILGSMCGDPLKTSDSPAAKLPGQNRFDWARSLAEYESRMELEVRRAISVDDSSRIKGAKNIFLFRDNGCLLPANPASVYSTPFSDVTPPVPVCAAGTFLDGEYGTVAAQLVFNPNEERAQRLRALKKDIRSKAALDSDSIVLIDKYECAFDQEGLDNRQVANKHVQSHQRKSAFGAVISTSENLVKGLEGFVQACTRELKRLVLQIFPSPMSHNRAVLDVTGEQREAEKFFFGMLQQQQDHIIGRQKEIDEIVDYLNDTSSNSYTEMGLLALTGPSGIGKTTVAAQVVQRLQQLGWSHEHDFSASNNLTRNSRTSK